MASDPTYWNTAKASLSVGESVKCIVKRHHLFGILVAIGDPPLTGLIERSRMSTDGFQAPSEYPPLGCIVVVTVLGFRDYSQQVELALMR